MRRTQLKQHISSGRSGAVGRRRLAGAPALGTIVLVIAVGCVPMAENDALDDIGSGDGGVLEPIEDRAEREPPADGRPATVLRVVDGDSVEVSLDGVETDIRLQNYNAPEKFDDAGDETCNGEASTAALAALLADGFDGGGADVQVVGFETDRFGRTLADLYIDGWSTTESLIAGGHGMATRDRTDWRALMKDAAADEVGMWGDRCGTAMTFDLRIGEIQANPPGPDEDVLEDEWVEIDNRGGEPIDLDGWVLRDDTTSHRFPLAGTIGPGDTLRVRTGVGSSSSTDVYLGEQFPVWSNSNETVLLVDPLGVVTDWAFVDGRG